MPRGSKPGERRGGRAKFVQNRSTRAIGAEMQRAIEARPDLAERLMPLEGMTLLMRIAARLGDVSRFFAVAKEVAPFLHPKLASQTIRLASETPLDRAAIEAELRALELKEALADGREEKV